MKKMMEQVRINSLDGLSTINIELTSKCNKNCWMCGRRRIEKEFPKIKENYGDIDFNLLKLISKQLPSNIVVQLHNNGEPLLYKYFGDAVKLFRNQLTTLDTNGKLLLEKFNEIVDNIDVITISIFENDEEQEDQYKIIEEFIYRKGQKKPLVVFRINGDVDIERYKKFNVSIAKRKIHSPFGSTKYKKKTPLIPEIGICTEFLHHPAINKDGDFSICVRFDPYKYGVIDNVKNRSLYDIWNSRIRKSWLNYHKTGRRKMVPLCSYCEYWGIPVGD